MVSFVWKGKFCENGRLPFFSCNGGFYCVRKKVFFLKSGETLGRITVVSLISSEYQKRVYVKKW